MIVKKIVRELNEKKMKKEISKSKKVCEFVDEKWETGTYLRDSNMEYCRILFAKRLKVMSLIKSNFKGDLLKHCLSCKECIYTQDHSLWC